MDDGGWTRSAEAWIRRMDEGESPRLLVGDPAMWRMIGDVTGQLVLDDGCGEGRFARQMVERGAEVVALDPTWPMVRATKDRGSVALRGDAQRLPFRDATFDLVVSYLVLIDVPDLEAAVAEATRIVKAGGRLAVVTINPFHGTSNRPWFRDEEGRKLGLKVDDYMIERAIDFEWDGVRIVNWHRPLTQVMQAFLDCGLRLERFEEPMPRSFWEAKYRGMDDEWRAPNFLAMLWSKP